MTLELARRLLATGAIAARDVEAALYLSVVRGVSIARALVDRGVLGERALEDELSRRAGLPLRQVSPSPEIVSKLPRGMCRMLAAVPLRFDPSAGVTEIAAVDPLDGHVATEFSFHLGTPVRVERATMESIEEAIRRLELAEGGAANRSRRRTPAFPHGAPDTVPPSPPPSKPSPEEVPIPLVRRLPSLGGIEGMTGAAAGLEAIPGGHWDASVNGGEPPRWSERPQDDPLPILDEDYESPRPRRVVSEAPDERAVSFPSAPPPPSTARAASGRLSMDAVPSYDPSPPSPTNDERDAHRVAPEEEPLVGEDDRTPIDDELPPVDGLEPQAVPMRSAVVDVPRAPDAGWSPTLPELLDLIGRAHGRDDLLDLVLRAATLVAQRAAVFVVRREGFTGWSCNPAFGSEEDLKSVVIPSTQPSIFATSAATGFYLGPIPRTPVHAGLLGVLSRPGSDVAVYVARVRNRPTVVLIADQLDDTLLGTRALGEITKRAGDALTRILAQR